MSGLRAAGRTPDGHDLSSALSNLDHPQRSRTALANVPDKSSIPIHIPPPGPQSVVVKANAHAQQVKQAGDETEPDDEIGAPIFRSS